MFWCSVDSVEERLALAEARDDPVRLFDVRTDVVSDKELVNTRQDRNLIEILAAITLYNTVIATDDGFSSESPDEETLVSYAKELDAVLDARVPDESMTVLLGKQRTTFDRVRLRQEAHVYRRQGTEW